MPVETVAALSIPDGGLVPCHAQCLDGGGCQEPLWAPKNHPWFPAYLTGSWTIVTSTTVEFYQILPRSQSLFESLDSTLIKESINIIRNNAAMLSKLMCLFFSKIHNFNLMEKHQRN